MNLVKRKIYFDLWQELSKEKGMVFLSGPRQAGKTTFAKGIAKDYKNNLYFNWDIISNKKTLIQNPAFFENINRVDQSVPLIILDEIHKYKNWKNYLKGIYDEFHRDYQFLISGSGRLDLYQKGGDSLAGRYLIFHLFPFTLAELSKQRNFAQFMKAPLNDFDINQTKATQEIWERLFNLSGFPEPYLKNKKSFWEKWSSGYLKQIIYEDIRDLSGIKNIENMAVLFSLLPSKIGSPLSINSLSRDLQIAFDTVKSWINLFDIAYLTFRISPWSKKIARSIVKEKKLYLFNYPEIEDIGARFENMAAVELLRAVYSWNEHGYGRFGLHYVRNKEKEEVDFLITNYNKPLLLIETKYSDDSLNKNLLSFQDKLNIPAIQLVFKNNVFKYYTNKKNKILIITAHKWLSSLP